MSEPLASDDAHGTRMKHWLSAYEREIYFGGGVIGTIATLASSYRYRDSLMTNAVNTCTFLSKTRLTTTVIKTLRIMFHPETVGVTCWTILGIIGCVLTPFMFAEDVRDVSKMLHEQTSRRKLVYNGMMRAVIYPGFVLSLALYSYCMYIQWNEFMQIARDIWHN